jgi:hypothetical protein
VLVAYLIDVETMLVNGKIIPGGVMELTTLFIVSGTAAILLAKMAVMAYCVSKIAESFNSPFNKKTFT